MTVAVHYEPGFHQKVGCYEHRSYGYGIDPLHIDGYNEKYDVDGELHSGVRERHNVVGISALVYKHLKEETAMRYEYIGTLEKTPEDGEHGFDSAYDKEHKIYRVACTGYQFPHQKKDNVPEGDGTDISGEYHSPAAEIEYREYDHRNRHENYNLIEIIVRRKRYKSVSICDGAEGYERIGRHDAVDAVEEVESVDKSYAEKQKQNIDSRSFGRAPVAVDQRYNDYLHNKSYHRRKWLDVVNHRHCGEHTHAPEHEYSQSA